MQALYPAIDAALAQLHRLSPLVEKTYIRTPFLDPLVDHYAEAIGFEPTLLKVKEKWAKNVHRGSLLNYGIIAVAWPCAGWPVYRF
jgi:hypothetical protein